MEFETQTTDDSAEDVDIEAIKKIIYELLGAVGEDPTRDGLKNTPDRVARMYSELLSGYRDDPNKVVNRALFDVQYDEMVIVRDIEFYSMCEHHMLPFIAHKCMASTTTATPCGFRFSQSDGFPPLPGAAATVRYSCGRCSFQSPTRTVGPTGSRSRSSSR